MNWDADGNLPLGRPPIVRNKVLACMQRLRRARVARIVEETGLQARSVHAALLKARDKGEVTRYRAEGYARPFYIYEIANE